MNNVESLQTNFPEAINVRRYLTRVREVIEPLGFDRSNTFTMTSVCRDELAQALIEEVTGFWQRPFDLGGLAGMPSGGIETWQAGLSHIGDVTGRGKLLVVAAAHIGIAPDGTLGRVHRHGQTDTTTACGALGAIAAELSAGNGNAGTSGEPADTEAGRLKRSVINAIGGAATADIHDVTMAAAGSINDSIWESLEYLAVHSTVDIVVCAGIQIHLHDDVDHIVPVASTFKGSDAKLTPLDLG